MKVFRAELTPLSFLSRSASVFGTKTAITSAEDGRTFSYIELKKRVERLAAALTDSGVCEGDRVAFLSTNNPELLEAHFGVPFSKAALVAINFRLTPKEISYIIQNSESKVFVYESKLSHLVQPIQDQLKETVKKFVCISSAVEIQVDADGTYEEFLRSATVAEPPSFEVTDENSLIAIDYTSGTTGLPKGVMYSHRGAYLNASSDIIQSGLRNQSLYLWTLPMFHCNGWCYTWGVVGAGAESITISKIDPAKVWDIIEEKGVTHLCAAPTVLASLALSASSRSVKLRTNLIVLTGGAPPAPKVIELMENLGAEVVHLYGLTETYGPNTICEWKSAWNNLSLAERCRIKGRQGVPHLHSHFTKVVDENMEEVPHDGKTMGEIVMKGNTVMLGYFKDPVSTVEAFRRGWFHSGDLAVVHPDGYVEIMDRKKDIIISGGEKISSIEVENVLYAHPSVLEAAVIAIPDAKWGEVPKAFVTLKPGANVTVDDLREFCRKDLAHFKCPREFEFGPIPKTSTGKIMKYVLREKEWKEFTKRVS